MDNVQPLRLNYCVNVTTMSLRQGGRVRFDEWSSLSMCELIYCWWIQSRTTEQADISVSYLGRPSLHL